MKRYVMLLFLVLAHPISAPADEKTPVPDVQKAVIRMTEFQFDPPELILTSGRPVELTLINEGSVLHEFITDALSQLEVDIETGGVIAETLGIAELEILPKEKVVLRFTPGAEGSYPFTCEAGKPTDHKKQGMTGMIIIR